MRRQIIFLFFLVLTHFVYGQKTKTSKLPPPPVLTKQQMKAEERSNDCIKKTNWSFTTRLRNYPFNKSAQVQFVSFKAITTSDKEADFINASLPIINDTICYSKLYEIKTLTFIQIDKLTDILYNYGYRGNMNSISVTGCYNPRNAILFLDSNGKVFEYIEICFECQKTVESSEKISLGELCQQKMNMLKELFQKVGIGYGITTDD